MVWANRVNHAPYFINKNTFYLYLTSLTLTIMCLVCIYSNSKDKFVQYLNISEEIPVVRIFCVMQQP
jgi:hypothetical protein